MTSLLQNLSTLANHDSTRGILVHFTPLKVFISLLVLLSSRLLYLYYFHPLAKVPGPFFAKFGRFWQTTKYFQGRWEEVITELHRQYGPVVRISADEVSVVDTGALKKLYGYGAKSQKTSWYDTWSLNQADNETAPNMFATTIIKEHRFLRRRVASVYSMSAILSMEPYVQSIADSLWSQLGDIAKGGGRVDISRWATFFAFDVVGTLSLGAPIGFLSQGKDVDGIIQAIHLLLWQGANLGYIPLQSWWIQSPVARLLAPLLTPSMRGILFFQEWINKRVDERKAHGLPANARRDMLQHFVEMKSADGAPARHGEIQSECGNIIGAGADTTSIAIMVILGDLLQHPPAFRRVQEEVDAAYETLGLKAGGREISYKEAEALPYLAAVIRESMRLQPSIVFQLPREVPEGGMQVGEFYLAEGTPASISPASMNRSKEIFGEDAEEWKPERWLVEGEDSEGKEKDRVNQMANLLTTFGMGSRSCVGKNLALVETHKFTAQFARHFDAELVNKDKPWVTHTYWFVHRDDFWIDIKERAV